MRAQSATKNADRYDITDADKGNVWGIDYAGPFPPDVDGNVYLLQGVEVGTTNMGYVQRSRCDFGVGMLLMIHTNMFELDFS